MRKVASSVAFGLVALWVAVSAMTRPTEITEFPKYSAFANEVVRMREPQEYLFEGTWETEDLHRDFAPFFGKAIPDDVIARHVSSLAVFTPKGLAWVLPQYLSYAARNPKSEAGDYVVYHLSSANRSDSYWKDRLSYLSADAKREIIDKG